MIIRTRSNITDVMELTASYHRALREQLLDPSVRQRFANEVAESGKAQLEEVTERNIDSTDRWKLSGMASKAMGGGAHTVEKSWTISSVTPEVVQWQNDNPIYRFLDAGTRDHGPVRAKKLFIPLNQATALAYLNGSLLWGQGVEGIVTPYEEESRQWSQKKQFKYLRKKIKGGGTRKLVYGVDYILKDRVKGITARFITLQFLDQFKEMLRHVLIKGRERWRNEVRSQGWIQSQEGNQ